MDPEGFRRVRVAFEAALEQPSAERAAFVRAELVGDEELIGQALAMLEGHTSSETFLRPPTGATLDGAALRGDAAESFGPGARLGDFELVRPLGGGGMGEVWEARQANPSRAVALKTLRAGLMTERARRRFAEEAELLARLSHPGIARVLASGVLSGPEGAPARPWFAMELVPDARTLTEAASGLEISERIELLLQVTDAVHHGHLRGVVHRDLKPDNVLVDRDGRAHVIDFGIGRAVEAEAQAAELTSQGEMLGTIAYMSPEQVLGDRERVDVRTDVHALGVLLYELLCDRSPWKTERSSWTKLAREVVDVDPPPPSRASVILVDQLGRARARELDWVVARALAKEPERRYGSAGELGAELRRFLANEALSAGPPGAAYQARKFARRHRAWVAGGAVAFALLLLGTAGTAWGWLRALDRQEKLEVARHEAQEEADRATALNRYLDGMLRAANPFDELVVTRAEMTVPEMLDLAAATLGDAFPGRPSLEAETRMLIGLTYHGQGRYEEALVHFERAVELFRSVPEPPAEALVKARRMVATTRARAGDNEDALERLRAVHDELADELDAKSPELGQLEADLAWLYSRRGRYAEALPFQERAYRLLLDAGSEKAAAVVHLNLAKTYRGLGRTEEAEATYRAAIEELAEAFGGREANVSVAMGNLGSFLAAEERYEEAREMLAGAAEIQREVLGDSHPTLGTTLSSLAGVLGFQKRYQEALAPNVEALAILREALGPDHDDTLSALNNLAFLQCDLGNWGDAARDYAEYATRLRAKEGPEFWRVVLTEAYAAEARLMSGGREEGAAELERLYHRASDLFGPGDGVTQAVARAGVRSHAGPEHTDARERWEARLD